MGRGGGKGGEDGVGVQGLGGWVTGAGYRGAGSGVGGIGGKCVRWIVDKTDRRQQTG